MRENAQEGLLWAFGGNGTPGDDRRGCGGRPQRRSQGPTSLSEAKQTQSGPFFRVSSSASATPARSPDAKIMTY